MAPDCHFFCRRPPFSSCYLEAPPYRVFSLAVSDIYRSLLLAFQGMLSVASSFTWSALSPGV